MFGSQGNSPIEVREKVHATTPMTLDQAVRDMELLGHDFYLYHDAETDRADRGVPPPRLVLRRDPPRGGPPAPEHSREVPGARAAREAVEIPEMEKSADTAERSAGPNLRKWAGAAALS